MDWAAVVTCDDNHDYDDGGGDDDDDNCGEETLTGLQLLRRRRYCNIGSRFSKRRL